MLTTCGLSVDPNVTNVCRSSADTFNGTCINDQCIVGSDGVALSLQADSLDDTLISTQNAEESTCRGYPEVMSPFSPFSSTDSKPGIVEQWVKYGDTNDDGVLEGTPIDSSSLITRNTAGPLYDAMPYTYVSGFQGQNVCAPNPNPSTEFGKDSLLTNSCDCSYTKVSYGTGMTSRYYSIANADNSNIPDALCMGGSVSGMSCTTDAECGSGGTCTLLTRKDTFNGWQGYCLERDLSINLYGNANLHPCITWLPVDALAGATDLYGKASEAGFPLENEYLCSQTGYYVDLYPTGAENGNDQIDLACASASYAVETQQTNTSEFVDIGNADGQLDCSFGQYDGCSDNVACPGGFVAILGWCNLDSDAENDGRDPGIPTGELAGNVCNDATEPSLSTSDIAGKSANKFGVTGNNIITADDRKALTDDCPYFCVPINSTHAEADHDDLGVSCISQNSDGRLEGEIVDDVSSHGETTTSDSGTTVYKFGNIYEKNLGDLSVISKYSDCAVRGLPYVSGENVSGDNGITYQLNWHDSILDNSDAFAFGFSSPTDDSDGSGGYAFVENPVTDQFAYGIAHRAVGAQIGVCRTNGRSCTGADDTTSCVLNFADYGAEALNGDKTHDCEQVCLALSGGWAGVAGSFGLTLAAIATCDAACVISSAAAYDPTCYVVDGTNNISGDIYPYLGCYEVSQTAVDQSDPSVSAGGTYNKAWTNRLMSSDSKFENQGQFPYTKDSSPVFAGALPFDSYYTWSGDDTEAATFTDSADSDAISDAFPLPVRSCVYNDGTTPGAVGIYTKEGSTVDSCDVQNSYPGDAVYDVANMGQSYEDMDIATDELAAIDGTITADSTSGSTSIIDGEGSNDGQAGIVQFFEKVIRTFTFDYKTGTYVVNNTGFDDTSAAAKPDGSSAAQGKDAVGDKYGVSSDKDVAGDGIGNGTDAAAKENFRAPTVMSIGYCKGANCEEGTKGAFSVNSQEEGNVFGSAGQAFVSVSFYAYANPNQMPIRNINVDWGNSKAWRNDPEDWPHDKMGGSTTEDNFYKNYRGYNPDGSGLEMCGTDDLGWGGSSEACQTGYVTFTNSYTCTTTDVQKLETAGRTCTLDELGHLQKSPCTGSDGTLPTSAATYADGACVFQPRVSVLDNWGWCTGQCGDATSGGSDGTSECYKGDSDNNECDISNCPSSTGACDVQTDKTINNMNPWINFNGYVIVTPP